MENETYIPDPTQPEGPHISVPIATELGSAMMQGAADAVSEASSRREAEQADQLARPLAPGAITEVPVSLTTTPETTTTVPHPTTTIRPTTTTTTIPTTTPPKGSEPPITSPNSY